MEYFGSFRCKGPCVLIFQFRSIYSRLSDGAERFTYRKTAIFYIVCNESGQLLVLFFYVATVSKGSVMAHYDLLRPDHGLDSLHGWHDGGLHDALAEVGQHCLAGYYAAAMMLWRVTYTSIRVYHLPRCEVFV